MKNRITIGIGTKLRRVNDIYSRNRHNGVLCQTDCRAVSFINLKGWDAYNRYRDAVTVVDIRDITGNELYRILGDLSQWEIKIGKSYQNLQKIVESV